MEYKKYTARPFHHYLSAVFLWGMAFPLILLDICSEIFHQVCFRLWRIPLVDCSKFIRFDRHKLPYLNTWDKIFCEYCAYVNGLLYYTSVIAGQTEKYWCAIKHENKPGFVPPPHHSRFLDYGDQQGYQDAEPDQHDHGTQQKLNS